MKIVVSIDDMQQIASNHRQEKIGFVPTMGFLHEGHLSLAKRAKEENDIVVMSIFVNPLQFGPNEDFDQYPRDEKNDIHLAKEVGVDYLFFPSQEEMYPKSLSLKMKMVDRVNVLCGASRPGHFDGVITVVTKLFHIVQPTVAYFGLKDAQQVAIIHALVKDLNFPVEVKALATVREHDGLAKSSRNKYLSSEERQQALALYKGLKLGEQLLQTQRHDYDTIKEQVKTYIINHGEGKLDYVELLEYPSLIDANEQSEQIMIAVAVKYKTARLIDNFIFDASHQKLEEVIF